MKRKYQKNYSSSKISNLKMIPDRLNSIRKLGFKKISNFIKKKPFTSFFLSLFILLILIIASATVFKPKTAEVSNEITPKEVQVYKIGSSSKITVLGQVEKAGVIKIVAQSGGIIQSINVSEGSQVAAGDNLIQLASNYLGGNVPGIQYSIAAKQYQQTKDTLDIQKDIINKQRNLAKTTETNFENLRNISNNSVSETQSLIDQDQNIIDSLGLQLALVDPNSTAGISYRSQQAQLQGGINQLKSGLRNTQYQVDTNQSPTQLANLQRDLTLKQLDVQEKSLEIGKEISGLQLALAGVNASLMHPVAPFSGVVQRIYVKVGQNVLAGAILLELSGDNKETSVVAKVPSKIAGSVSIYQPSLIHINGKVIEAIPVHVATEATDGMLYSVIYSLPAEWQSKVSDGSFVNVEVPIALPDTGSAVPFIPLDSVFQTQTESIIYILQNNRAVSRNVTLGSVLGNSVAVTNGLNNGDKIILNRTVIEGDPVVEASR